MQDNILFCLYFFQLYQRRKICIDEFAICVKIETCIRKISLSICNAHLHTRKRDAMRACCKTQKTRQSQWIAGFSAGGRYRT